MIKEVKQSIRKGVFETNSSSTHAMAIQNYPNVMLGIYAGWSDEQIDQYNADVNVKEGWRTTILKKNELPKFISFKEGCFGWEHRTIEAKDYNTKASYIFTLMYSSLSYDEFDEAVKRIKKWLNDVGIECEFQEYTKIEKPHVTEYEYQPNTVNLVREDKNSWGYVDHPDEAEAFLCYVIFRKYNFLNYLFGDSYIKTGNDNDGSDISLYNDEFTFKCSHVQFYKGN